jgi:hypothetical protein
MAELVDAPVLGTGGNPCRFKSCYPHEIRTLILIRCVSILVSLYFLDVDLINKSYALEKAAEDA